MRRLWVLVGAFCFGACGEDAYCAVVCDDSGSLTFEPALGAPGSYVVQIGTLSRCEFVLPASSVRCSNEGNSAPQPGMEAFAVRTVRWSGRPIGEVRVRITRDGAEVVNQRVTGQKSVTEVCGARCESGSATLSIPAELGPTERPPCTIDALNGTYAVLGVSPDTSCYPFASSHEVTLLGGQLNDPRPSCTTSQSSFDVAQCKLVVGASCHSDLASFDWNLTVEDALGDGSVLLGSVDVSMRAPSACTQTLPVRLQRQ